MANFGGHAIPGSFFLLFGLWWSVKFPLRHYCKKSQRTGRHNVPLFAKLDYAEGAFKIFASFVGIMVEQFVVDGPHARLYSREAQSWVKLMNWQHSTMYLFYGISGIADILSLSSTSVPVGLDRLGMSLALFVEGFLFYFHVHSRPPLDSHIHSLLLVAVFGGASSTMLEVFMRDDMVLEMLRASLALLQGSWFYQIGFVLYPLNGEKWDLTLHDNIMFVTMCFCWHIAVAVLIVTMNSYLVWFAVKKCSRVVGGTEIGMRTTSSFASSEKALLQESDED